MVALNHAFGNVLFIILTPLLHEIILYANYSLEMIMESKKPGNSYFKIIYSY